MAAGSPEMTVIMLLPWRGQPFDYGGRGGGGCDYEWIVTLFPVKSYLELLAIERPAMDNYSPE